MAPALTDVAAALAPVLSLPREQLFSELFSGSQPLEPIPTTFTSWRQYLDSFRAPFLEEVRTEIARSALASTTFARYEVTSSPPHRQITLRGFPRLQLNDICLVAARAPAGERRDVVAECGWCIVGAVRTSKPDANLGPATALHACAAWELPELAPSKGPRAAAGARVAFVSVISSGISAGRVLNALADLARRKKVSPALRSLVFAGVRGAPYDKAADDRTVTPVTPVAPTAPSVVVGAVVEGGDDGAWVETEGIMLPGPVVGEGDWDAPPGDGVSVVAGEPSSLEWPDDGIVLEAPPLQPVGDGEERAASDSAIGGGGWGGDGLALDGALSLSLPGPIDGAPPVVEGRQKFGPPKTGGERRNGGAGRGCGRGAAGGEAPPAPPRPREVEAVLATLNESQGRAVDQALRQSLEGGISLIQGPPGTGKTHTIVSLLSALLLQRPASRLLLCAPTNIAVAEVAKRLIERRPAAVSDADVLIIVNLNKVDDLDPCIHEFTLPVRARRMLEGVDAVTEQMATCVDVAEAALAAAAGDVDGTVETLRQCFDDVAQLAAAHKQHGVTLGCNLRAFTQVASVIRAVEKRAAAVAALPSDASQALPALTVEFGELKRTLLDARAVVQRDVLVADSTELSASALHGVYAYLIKRARLYFCTLNVSMSTSPTYPVASFPIDVAVVDEAAQAKEAELCGLFRPSLKSLVLVGDPRQLSGTVFSDEARRARLHRSLFARLADELAFPVDLLATQYRMHPRIAAFPSEAFYGGRLANAPSVMAYDRPWLADRDFRPLQFWAHRGSQHQRDASGSSYNEVEAGYIVRHVQRFLQTYSLKAPENGCLPVHEPVSIGIICPYLAQKATIQALAREIEAVYHPMIDVNTVDGFQGQERDVIIVSLTACRATEFLNSPERMNVAATRARYSLWLFGDHSAFVPPPLQGHRLAEDLAAEEEGRVSMSVWSRLARHCELMQVLRECGDEHVADCVAADSKLRTKLERRERAEAPALATRVEVRAAVAARAPEDVWTVVATESLVADVVHSCERAAFARLVAALKVGDLSATTRPYLKDGGAAGKLFYASKMTPAVAVVWTIELRGGAHVISLLRHVSKTALAAAWAAFRAAFARKSDEYVAACLNVLKGPAKRVFPRKDVFDVAVRPADGTAANMDGSAKQFDVSTDALLRAFEAGRVEAFALPYLLDERQVAAAEALGSVVIVGRGGTGKTAVLASRLFAAYRRAVVDGITPPRQLFVSQSRGLVQTVQLEFTDLVDTFHATEQHQRPPGDPALAALLPTHNVAFRCVFDLIRVLDDLSPPSERLFVDVGAEARSELMRAKSDPRRHTELSVVDFDRFEHAYWPAAPDALRKAFSAEFVYTELMGVIKRELEPLTREAYLALKPAGDGAAVDVTPQQRALIYEFFVKYERERAARRHVDFPGVVKDLLRRVAPATLPFDVIFLDEVQDLLNCQWRLLAAVRDGSTHIVCSGDQAQTITAGAQFRFSALKGRLYDDAARTPATEVFLSVNYRTVLPVLRLANAVLDVIRAVFPHEIDALAAEESAHAGNDEAHRPALLQDAALEALAFLFRDCGELAAEQAVLVRSREAKEEVEGWMAARGYGGAVLTVLEAKGLEFNDVVLYNVLSSTRLGSRIRVLYRYVAEERRDASVRLPELDLRKHSALCQLLKELYVAVTRAKQRVLIVEQGDEERRILQALFDDRIRCTSSASEPTFSRESDKATWLRKALQFEAAKLLPQARRAFLKAGQPAPAKRCEALMKLREAAGAESEAARSALTREAAALYEDIDDLPTAAATYYRGRMFADAARVYAALLPGTELEVVECHRAGRDWAALHAVVDRFHADLGAGKADELYYDLAEQFYGRTPERSIVCLDSISDASSAVVLSFLETRVEGVRQRIPPYQFPAHDLPLAALMRMYVKHRAVDHGLAFLGRLGLPGCLNELLSTLPPELRRPGLDESMWDARNQIARDWLQQRMAQKASLPIPFGKVTLQADLVGDIMALVASFKTPLPRTAPAMADAAERWAGARLAATDDADARALRFTAAVIARAAVAFCLLPHACDACAPQAVSETLSHLVGRALELFGGDPEGCACVLELAGDLRAAQRWQEAAKLFELAGDFSDAVRCLRRARAPYVLYQTLKDLEKRRAAVEPRLAAECYAHLAAQFFSREPSRSTHCLRRVPPSSGLFLESRQAVIALWLEPALDDDPPPFDAVDADPRYLANRGYKNNTPDDELPDAAYASHHAYYAAAVARFVRSLAECLPEDDVEAVAGAAAALWADDDREARADAFARLDAAVRSLAASALLAGLTASVVRLPHGWRRFDALLAWVARLVVLVTLDTTSTRAVPADAPAELAIVRGFETLRALVDVRGAVGLSHALHDLLAEDLLARSEAFVASALSCDDGGGAEQTPSAVRIQPGPWNALQGGEDEFALPRAPDAGRLMEIIDFRERLLQDLQGDDASEGSSDGGL